MPVPTLIEAFDRARPARLIVFGDLILDEYTHGEAERISQEAPILVLRATRREARPGGAANVASMVRALGAEVWCAGVTGDDGPGRTLRESLDATGARVDGLFVDATRPTTRKERFVGHTDGRNAHQILRVDHESRDGLSDDLARRLGDAVRAELPRCDGLLIADYGKGVCSAGVLGPIIAAARGQKIPVLVDPRRGADFAIYGGATLLKPNRVETALATGRPVGSPADAVDAGQRLCARFGLDMAVVTLDRDGMALVRRDQGGQVYPTEARDVCDITGAGDMVLSCLGVLLCGGVAPEPAVRIANLAAGIEVERLGVSPITRDELRRRIAGTRGASPKIVDVAEAARLAEQYRTAGQRVAFTNGCYDLFHAGHAMSLAAAAAEADALFVGVNSDASVRRLKGPSRPVVGEQDRMAVLAALACVSHVVLFDEPAPHALLRAIRPDRLVKGGTYAPCDVVGREVVEAYGGEVRVTPVVEGLSTTRLVESIRERAA